MPPFPITHYFIGFDLGRDRDHAALRHPTRLVLELGALQRIPRRELITNLRYLISLAKTKPASSPPPPCSIRVVTSAAAGNPYQLQ